MTSEKETVSQRKALGGVIFGIAFIVTGIWLISITKDEFQELSCYAMIFFGVIFILYYSYPAIKQREQK